MIMEYECVHVMIYKGWYAGWPIYHPYVDFQMKLHEVQSSIDAKVGGIMFENESVKDYHVLSVQKIFKTMNVTFLVKSHISW